jgi:hypothetical protein
MATGEAARARLGAELVERFLGEIQRIDADVRFVGPGVEVGLDLRLSGRESLFARVIVPRSAPVPPPPAFYRLPADAIVAAHTTGALPEDIAPLRKAIAENVEATLVQDGYQADKTRVVRERLETLLFTGGPMVIATGISGGRDGAEAALAAVDAARQGADALRVSGRKSPEEDRAEAQAQSAFRTWVMIEVDEPAARWTQGLRDVVRFVEDADKTRKPGSKASSPRDPDGDHVDVRIAKLDPALKLPNDGLHLEILIAPRKKGARPTRKGHLFVVPKGASTWLGYSEDVAGISARLRLALDDATETGTLSKSAEASSLRGRPAIGAGIVVVGALGYLGTKMTTTTEVRLAASSAAHATKRGARGSETLTWTLAADPTPGSVHVSARTQATRQTVIDLLQALGL